ncbi:hypothetical protein AMTR_s00038p00194690 [Amborella trichopoda]|uniref:Aspartic peptidase DDI1-type domain-containing protein n=1 Tax=Amborella trichopoda TaxID=13333 RepID=U5CXG8_AMBTC|nr:hypothetical protein AMTR_s00038p00194690 [Amborella trichopoda]
MRSLQLFIGMKAEKGKAKAPSKGLMFIEVQINGKAMRVMIDTRASHNFVSTEEANRPGLQFAKEMEWVKVVNSEAKPIRGMVLGVDIRLGPWTGKVDLSIVPMDDY